jgi:hypothetical protein
MFSPPLRGKLLKKILDLNKPDAEVAEIKFFSFVAEKPTNENPQPLRGRINVLKNTQAIICSNMPLLIGG